MPRVKKNKEKMYNEFIQKVRLNNLKTIKRIFNTADKVTECILENYDYHGFGNEDFFTLREISGSIFDFSERKILIVMLFIPCMICNMIIRENYTGRFGLKVLLRRLLQLKSKLLI